MTTKITSTQLARTLSDVLNRVIYKGERFVIERGGQAVANLNPPSPVRAVPLHEFVEKMRGKRMPGQGFAEDLALVQKEQPREEMPDWPS